MLCIGSPEGALRLQAGCEVRSTTPLLLMPEEYKCRRYDRISVTPSGFRFVVASYRGLVLRTPPLPMFCRTFSALSGHFLNFLYQKVKDRVVLVVMREGE